MLSVSLKKVLKTCSGRITDVVFPPCCLACATVQPLPDDGLGLCQECRQSAMPAGESFCPKCAMPLPLADSACSECRRHDFHFERGMVLGTYRGRMRDWVLQIKNSDGESLALVLGKLLGNTLACSGISENVDAIVPIPMYWLKRMWRGYHAADVLADGCARSLQLPIYSDLLRCNRWARKQGTLSRPQRLRNMRGVFSASARYQIPGSRLLLVDDVITTGVTMNEAAKALLKAGAEEIIIAAVAHGTG